MSKKVGLREYLFITIVLLILSGTCTFLLFDNVAGKVSAGFFITLIVIFFVLLVATCYNYAKNYYPEVDAENGTTPEKSIDQYNCPRHSSIFDSKNHTHGPHGHSNNHQYEIEADRNLSPIRTTSREGFVVY